MRPLIKITLFLIILIFISFIVLESYIVLEGSKTYNEEVDYLFILGAKLYGDKPSPALLERLKTGLDYLETHRNVRVIVSGGKGNDEFISEAEAMKNHLIQNGVDSSRIVLEGQSTNTFQNIKFSLEKINSIDNDKNPKVLIATSKFHMLRAKLIAKRLGLEAYGLPAKVPPTTIVQSYIREYFALIKTFFFDR